MVPESNAKEEIYAKLIYERDTRTAKDTISFKEHHIKAIYGRFKCIFNLYFLIIVRFMFHELFSSSLHWESSDRFW